jgi:DNA-binding GntR family transcriptional regulator
MARNQKLAEGLPSRREEESSRAGRTYAALRDVLIQGGFPPGERLSIRRIATALGVSPMPVLAALQRLAAEHCLDILPNGAAIVPLITRSSLREITKVRLLLEPPAAAAAVPCLKAAEIAALRRIAADARAARAHGDEDTYRRGDRELHQRYYAAADQKLLLSIIEPLWMRRSAVLALARPVLRDRPEGDDHEAILAAAEACDPAAAAEAVRLDIERCTVYLLDKLRFPEDPEPVAEGWAVLRPLGT